MIMLSVVYKKDDKTEEKTEASILKTLAYFSIFQYPLNRSEIADFIPPGCTDIDSCLSRLVSQNDIFLVKGFYLLTNEPALVDRRLAGNKRAARLLPRAFRNGRFLFRFPYVRGIAISGSLSKNYADDNADIDFFIITKRNRLWIARTIMHLFKKLTYLPGHQHYYCMNYYIDESALLIENHNMYTAIETTTLLPVCGNGMNDFFKTNQWAQHWFAGYETHRLTGRQPSSWFKTFVEKLFNNKAGEWLDNYLMKLTTSRWNRKKAKKLKSADGKEMDLITGRHFARSNPGMFQEKLLARYEQEIRGLK